MSDINDSDLGDVENFSPPSLPISVWLDREAPSYGDQVGEALKEEMELKGKIAGKRFHTLLQQQVRALSNKWADDIMVSVEKKLVQNLPNNLDLSELRQYEKEGNSMEFWDFAWYEAASLSVSFFLKGLLPYLSSSLRVISNSMESEFPMPVEDEILESNPNIPEIPLI